MSIVDLWNGYFQIKLQRESRPLTSSTAPNGLRFQYKSVFLSQCQSQCYVDTFDKHSSGKSSNMHVYMDDKCKKT